MQYDAMDADSSYYNNNNNNSYNNQHAAGPGYGNVDENAMAETDKKRWGDAYWDIDEILAEHQRVPASFHVDIPTYGFLEGNHEDTLSRNVLVELPFWLACDLSLTPGVDDLLSISVPKCFQQRITNDLDAGPASVNLHALCPYFYLFGMKIVLLCYDGALAKTLGSAFTTRLIKIMRYCQSSVATDRNEFLQTLDESEKELFHIGQESALATRRWLSRASGEGKIRTAGVLQRSFSTRGSLGIV